MNPNLSTEPRAETRAELSRVEPSGSRVEPIRVTLSFGQSRAEIQDESRVPEPNH